MEGQRVNGSAGAATPMTAPTMAQETPSTKEQPKYIAPETAAVVLAADSDVARFMPVMAIEQAVARRQAIVDATQKLMRADVDFGKVPGTDREVLLQPGADKLCNLFGLVIQYEVVKSEEDWTGESHGGTPFFFYEVRGRAYRGDYLMGEGVGSCNSWESKYRWRKAERICPSCGKANIRKSRDGGGWYCWLKTDGCGATFKDGDASIEKQETGRKANPDMADVVNTILKMAYKRTKVSTTINATSASEFFTQDIEEGAPPVDDDPRGLRVDIGAQPHGTAAAQQVVAERKIAELKTRGEVSRAFAGLREKIGEFQFLSVLEKYGVRNAEQFRDAQKARECYREMLAMAKEAA